MSGEDMRALESMGVLPVSEYQPNPCVRITVTYRETSDLPETLDVVWEVAFPGPDSVAAVIEQLLAAPREHRSRAT